MFRKYCFFEGLFIERNMPNLHTNEIIRLLYPAYGSFNHVNFDKKNIDCKNTYR